MKDKYAVVTVVSSFKQRYVVPFSELQKLNEDVKLTDSLAIEWANDSVTSEEVKEFSQKWLGESIIDTDLLEEEEIMALFKKDNVYLSEGPDAWSDAKILDYCRNWKEQKAK